MDPIRTPAARPDSAGSPPGLVVALRHTLLDGSSHIDLLIDPPRGVGEPVPERVLTYRLPANPLLGTGLISMEAQKLSDHRQLYLDYEGEVSGGRGSVRRESRAEIVDWRASAAGWWLVTGDAMKLTGCPVGKGLWIIERTLHEA